MEYFNNILCISGSELIKPSGFLKKNTYQSLVTRKKIEVIRNGGGEGSPALIAFDSLPQKYKAIAIELYGDPKKEAETKTFLDCIVPDPEAQLEFASFKFEDGKGISVERQLRYTNEASILNAIHEIHTANLSARKGKLMPEFWEKVVEAVKCISTKYENKLPRTPRRLESKFNKYLNEGYKSLIHGSYRNNNADKLAKEAEEWVLARWAAPVNKVATISQLLKEYNEKVNTEKPEGWKNIKREETLIAYLNIPEVQRLWKGIRHGELLTKEKYSRQHRTLMPTMRDSLWYSDGTKMNYYYLDEKGKVSTCYVYEIIDAYSESFLGFHIGKTENYEMQYLAYKMGIQFAGCRPYEIRYDNQGGHKKLENGDLLGRLARLSIRTTPYNGKSKTIESAFGRFQQQYLKKDWFFTGQNITARKEESKANMEFILANKNKLPSLDQVKQIYEARRNEWNNDPHHKTGIPRIAMYNQSSNEKAVKVGFIDIINIFGITTKKPITYRANGIEMIVDRVAYPYEVLNDNIPDMDFNRKNIGKKFFVRYCPDDMSMVALYEKKPSGMVFVEIAQEYLTIHRNIQEQEEGESQFIKERKEANEQERIKDRQKIEEVLKKHNEHPVQHNLRMPNLKGIGKVQKATSELMEAEESIDPVKLKKKQARIQASEKKTEQELYEKRHKAYLESKIAQLEELE